MDSLTILPSANPSVLYPQVFGYDLSTRITVALTQASVNEDYFIEGINHDWNAQEPEMRQTTWQLSNASNITYPVRTTVDLYPNAAGDLTQFTPVGQTYNWQCVVTAGSGSYVDKESATHIGDLYNLTDMASVGPVVSLKVFSHCKSVDGSGNLYNQIKSGGTTYQGAAHNVTSSYAWYSDSFNVPMTLALINALQAGIYFDSGNNFNCDAVYVEIQHYSNY